MSKETIIKTIMNEAKLKKAVKKFEMHMKDIDGVLENQQETEDAIQDMVDETKLRIEDASFDYADGTGHHTHRAWDVYLEDQEDIIIMLTIDEVEDNTIDELIKGTPFTFDEIFDNLNLKKSYTERGDQATLKLDYKTEKIDKHKAKITVSMSDDIDIRF